MQGLCGWTVGNWRAVRARSMWVCGEPSWGVWSGHCVMAGAHGPQVWFYLWISAFCGTLEWRMMGPGRQSLHVRQHRGLRAGLWSKVSNVELWVVHKAGGWYGTKRNHVGQDCTWQ